MVKLINYSITCCNICRSAHL